MAVVNSVPLIVSRNDGDNPLSASYNGVIVGWGRLLPSVDGANRACVLVRSLGYPVRRTINVGYLDRSTALEGFTGRSITTWVVGLEILPTLLLFH